MDISVQNGGLTRFWGDEKGYQMIRDAGFDGIDWNIDNAWSSKELNQKIMNHCIFEDSVEEILAHYQKELEAIRAAGLKIFQAHAPFPAYIPDFPEFNEYAIGIYKNCILFCDRVGVKKLVIHGASQRLNDYTQTPASMKAMNYHLYESLIPTLLQTDVTVCLENLFTHNGRQIIEGTCSIPEEAVEYIDTLNAKAGRECFGLCLDTGHLNLLGKNQGNYIRALGSRIKALHVHDNMGDDDSHLAPYTGNIIWKDVIQGLKDIGYRENFNFETFRQVTLERVDPEMVPIWLKAIHDMGVVFTKMLEQ